MKCKITNKPIDPFMTFGKMPIANGFIEKKNFLNEFYFEMEVGFSEDLSLFQLNDHPKPENMFNNSYPFYAGSSEYMKSHFKSFSTFIKDQYINASSKIIEIGSNDGTLLKNFLDTKNKSISIKFLSLANNNLLIFLNNSYLVAFSKDGKIQKIEKLKSKLGTFPIFIDKSILFLDKKNKLIVLN